MQNVSISASAGPEAPRPRISSNSNQQLLSHADTAKQLMHDPSASRLSRENGFAVEAPAPQLVLALPLTSSTLETFSQALSPASQAVLSLSVITQEDVGKVTSLTFRYSLAFFSIHAGVSWPLLSKMHV